MNRQDLAYVLDSDANDTLQLGERRRLNTLGHEDEPESLRQTVGRKKRKGTKRAVRQEQDSPRSGRRNARTHRGDTIEEESKTIRSRKPHQTSRQLEEHYYAVDYTSRRQGHDSNSSDDSVAELQRQRQQHRKNNEADNFRTFSEQFYPQRSARVSRRPPGLGSQRQQAQVNQLFENQYIKEYPTERRGRKQVEWQCKATKEGFLYFFLPGTNTYQWNFPVVYDPVSGRKRTVFLENWVKKFDKAGKKYYRDTESGSTQEAKPDSETYLIQAAMLGNIAFLEIYMKARGSLAIKDQRGRNALHHSVAHGHRQITAMLCEFGSFENLVEGQDKSGNTPLFAAVRHDQEETLKVLLQYNCNLFYRNSRGDSCLHIAAANNAQQSLVVLASFVSEQLFAAKNRDGMTALDIAESLRYKGCAQTLTVLQRNVVFRNAISQRDQEDFADGTERFKSSSHRQQSSPSFLRQGSRERRSNQQHRSSDGSEEYAQPHEESRQNLDYEGHMQKVHSQRQHHEQILQHDREFKRLSSRRHKRLKKEKIHQQTPPFYRQKANTNRSHSLHLNESQFTWRSPVVNSSRIQESYFDDEMQARVSRSARQRERQFQQFDERDPADQQSALESAINRTQRFVSTIGNLVKYGYSSLVEFVWQDAPRLGSHRNRVMSLPPEHMTMQTSLRGTGDLSNDSSCFEFQYDSQHGQSRAMPDYSEESSASDYMTAFSRTRSRPNRSASKRRTDREAYHEQLPDLSNQAHADRRPDRNSSSPISSRARGQANPLSSKNVHFAEKSQAEGSAKQMPPEPTEETGQQTMQEGEEVMTRSICIQAMPTKRRKRKVKASDLSKRSIGVGSMCIDDSTLMGDASKTVGSQGSGSLASKGKLARQKKNQMTEQAKEFVKKRYLSSEDERRTKEDSDKLMSTAQKDLLHSNQKSPFVNNQDQLLGIGKDQDGFRRQAIRPDLSDHPQEGVKISEQHFVRISKVAPSLPLPPTTPKQTLSRSPPSQAPGLLTKAQLDIVNLNGQLDGSLRERSNSNSKYQLDNKVENIPEEKASTKSTQKIQTFYAKMALHEQMTEQSDSDMEIKQLVGNHPAEAVHFDPLEQDEENYEYHHENMFYFDGSTVEDNILEDLRKEQLDNISDCSFMPGHGKRETNQGASCMTANQLDRGQFIQQSCASITHQFNRSSVGLATKGSAGNQLPPSLNMVNYQSDSETVGAGRTTRTIPMPIPSSPGLPRQTPVEAAKKAQDKIIGLFSDEAEQKGLRTSTSRQGDAEDATKEEPEQVTRSEPPSELFKGNETSVLDQEAAQQTSQNEEEKQEVSHGEKNPNQVRTLLSLAQKEGKDASRTTSQGGLAQQKGVTRYLDSHNESTFIFELSKDLSNTNILSTKEVNKDNDEVFPPQNLQQPVEEQSQSTQALQLKQANKSTGSQDDKAHQGQQIKPKPTDPVAKGTSIVDELDSISQIYDQLETIQESIEQQDRGLGIIPVATPFDAKAQTTPEKTASKQSNLFYSRIGKGNFKPSFSPAVSSGPDEEAVLIGRVSDQEVLDPGQFKYDKQNRSTTAALFNNQFLSSASEGEDDGNRKRIGTARQARRRQNPMAIHSSSVNNGAAPLYGQRLQKQKSINQVKYRPSSNEGASEVASNRGADPTMTSEKGDNVSVSDRFKQSLQAFKLNKLIKPGSLNSSRQNTSVAMSQKSTNMSQAKTLAKKTT